METQLGPCTIVRRLAVGGMAEIFLARRSSIEGFETLVVVKKILPQYAGDGEFVRMFLREARLAATLQHPNIAQIYDIGRSGGTYFCTMEYVHGIDVRRLVRAAADQRQDIPLGVAIAIALGVAAGLHHVHELRDDSGRPLGIVHRDVSPSNVLVGFHGGVKLADFGIAKATQRRSETVPGTLKGKLGYMSPEQCQQRPLDRRSDIFALGAVLFELTTGTPLFAMDSDVALLQAIVSAEIPRPTERRASYPPALEAIVMRALQRDPDKRHADARELHLELEAFAREAGLSTSPFAVADYVRQLFGAAAEENVAGAAEDLGGGEPATETQAIAPAAPQPTVREPRRAMLWMAALACVLAAGLVVWRMQTHDDVTPSTAVPVAPEHVVAEPPPPPAASETPPAPELAAEPMKLDKTTERPARSRATKNPAKPPRQPPPSWNENSFLPPSPR